MSDQTPLAIDETNLAVQGLSRRIHNQSHKILNPITKSKYSANANQFNGPLQYTSYPGIKEYATKNLDIHDKPLLKSSHVYEYLQKTKDELRKNSFALIPGEKYYNLLVFFGALPEDLQKISNGEIHRKVEKDQIEAMSFRQLAGHRVLLEKNLDVYQRVSDDYDRVWVGSSSVFTKKNWKFQDKSKIIPAGVQACLRISEDEVASTTSTIAFKRSGTRKMNMPPKTYVNSSIPTAMAKLNDFLQPEKHHFQEKLNINSKFTINDQYLVRINKDENFIDASPTPEGIHQDGCELVTVTLIHLENVCSGAESRLWTLDQPTGNYDTEQFGDVLWQDFAKRGRENESLNGFSWNNCVFDKALSSPWETLIFNDRELKHEARAFVRNKDSIGPCYRDVIVNFLKKPYVDGSDEMMINGKVEKIY